MRHSLIRVRFNDDDTIQEIRDLDQREFPGASWPDSPGAAWWTIDGDPEAGYCGAVLGPRRLARGGWAPLEMVSAGLHGRAKPPCLHLTRGVVAPDFRGQGLQARMISVRLAWGRRHGAEVAQTYTYHDNVPSMRNLARAGFLPLRAGAGYIRWERAL